MRTAPDDTLQGLQDRKAVVDLLHYYCHAGRELKADAPAAPRQPRAEARAVAAGGARRG